MTEEEKQEFLNELETKVIQMGGGAKRGLICKKELEDAEEIRVSIRPPKFLGSIELFTLRKLNPADYHLLLVAVPRNTEGN